MGLVVVAVSAFPWKRFGERAGRRFRAGALARAGERSAGARGDARCRSAAGRERADRVEHGGVVGLPGPAGGHPEGPLPAGAGQAGGDLEQVPAAGAGGLHRPGREPDLGGSR